jgi:hypothetical protein
VHAHYFNLATIPLQQSYQYPRPVFLAIIYQTPFPISLAVQKTDKAKLKSKS